MRSHEFDEFIHKNLDHIFLFKHGMINVILICVMYI